MGLAGGLATNGQLSGGSSGTITSWAASTSYVAGQAVVTPDGLLQTAKTSHTSSITFDPSKWTRIGDGAFAKQLRSTVFLGLPVVASGGMRVGGSATGTQLLGNSRRQVIATVGSTDVRIVFPGYSYDTVDAAQQMSITAGIEYPLGATPYPVFFGGQLAGKVDPGGVMLSDPVGIDIKAGDAFYIRTAVSVPNTGGFPANYTSKLSRNEGGNVGAADASKLTTGITSADGVGVYTPLAVIGIPTGASAFPPVIGFVGDSILKGDLDPDEIGFALRAMNDQFGWIDAAKGGETAATFATAASSQKRRRVLSCCTHIVCNHVVNDLSSTLASIQANNLVIWTWFANRNQRVWHLTCTPRTTSSDSWATTVNQAVTANEAKRTAFNDWLRAGAPIDSVTKAVISGTGNITSASNQVTSVTGSFVNGQTISGTGITAGTTILSGGGTGTLTLSANAFATTSSLLLSAGNLLSGRSGHPLYSYFDTGAPMEVNAAGTVTQNGGFWKVDGSANTYSSDGLHPSTAGHVLMAANFDTTKFV